MRLLHSNDFGGFSLAQFRNENVPSYAILSHTWGPDDDEVSFEDLQSCIDWEELGLRKPGVKKLQFCARQAAADGLQYFWVDTCCINKLSDQELSESINSMFRWYRRAARCSVYLSDVVATKNVSNGEAWEEFQKSRWFTRGWTLQELLAAKRVDFFDTHGAHIGDTHTLSQRIQLTTGIPPTALHGQSLQNFSIEQRLSWAQYRQTKREEDAAYSLLGIFDISMPLIYGEGRDKAYHRLLTEIEASGRTRKLNEKYRQYLPTKEPPYQYDATMVQNHWDASIVKTLNPSDGYQSVHVLIVKWQDDIDQLHVKQEVNDLSNIFREIFNYDVTHVQLEAEKAQQQLNMEIANFVYAHDEPANLLIIYYAGHGAYDPNTKQLEISPSDDLETCSPVNWNQSERPFFEAAQSDVFLIMDCCYTSYLTPSSRRSEPESSRTCKMLATSSGRIFEMLTASSIGQRTSRIRDNFFTHRLINTLKELAGESAKPYFTTWDVMERLQKSNPENAPALWRRVSESHRHIRLYRHATSQEHPKKKTDEAYNPQYLQLGFELMRESIREEHIDTLTKELPRIFSNAGLPIVDIKWLGYRKAVTVLTSPTNITYLVGGFNVETAASGSRFKELVKWIIRSRREASESSTVIGAKSDAEEAMLVGGRENPPKQVKDHD